MDAFETGRIDENLCKGFGRGEPADLAGTEFERNCVRRSAFSGPVVKAGPKRGVHDREQVAKDAILIEDGDHIELGRYALRNPGPLNIPAIRI